MKMNKIYTESSIGELIDRITILEIKKIKISKKSDLAHVNKECQILKKVLKKNVKISSKIKKLWKELKVTNRKMWEMEDQKRLTQKSLEKLSTLAKNVYKLNGFLEEKTKGCLGPGGRQSGWSPRHNLLAQREP